MDNFYNFGEYVEIHKYHLKQTNREMFIMLWGSLTTASSFWNILWFINNKLNWTCGPSVVDWSSVSVTKLRK